MDKVTFRIPGKPCTKGSVRAYRIGQGRPIILPDCSRLQNWSSVAALVAGAHFRTPILDPVEILATFVFHRPKSHYRAGRNRDTLRDDAPIYHAQRPDIDKCARALLDALTGVAYRDDAQVVRLALCKQWSGIQDETVVTVRYG